MNLFELFVKIGVNDEASGKIAKITSSLGGGLKTAAEVGVKAIATASTAMTTLASVAVKNFAEYEQLVGGAELMYGDAFEAVMENSREAYKTVQMSQNEYLQQVNGFATGLKTALGGNEQAAADLSHRIVQAEADIIAATGNTAENVQNAFNGIMKSNFTMLDNLQIGITPTKEGFQEVIDKVNEWNTANGKATEYQMGNLADMQSALVDYIEMVGMSGYAQNEAAETIQGSLAMTKSAWSNLLTGMADDSADLNGLIDDFVESVGIAAENVIPRVEVALEGAIDVVDKLVPLALEKIPTLVVQLGPKIAASGVSALRSLVSGIIDNKDELIDAASEMVLTLVDGLADMAPDVIDGAIELFNGIVDAIPAVAIKVLREMPRIAKAIVEGLMNAIPAVFSAVGELLDPTTWALAEVREEIDSLAGSVTPFQDAIDAAVTNLSYLSGVMSDSGKTLGDLDDEISDVEKQINKILEEEYKVRDGLRESEIQSIKDYMDQISALEKEKLQIYRSAFIVEVEKILLEGETLTEEQAASFYASSQELLDQANQSVEEAYNAELTRILDLENAAKTSSNYVATEFEKMRKDAKTERDTSLQENEQFYADAISAITQYATDISDVSVDSVFNYSESIEKIKSAISEVNSYYENQISNLRDSYGLPYLSDKWGFELDDLNKTYLQRLKEFLELNGETVNAFLSTIAIAAESGAEIGEESEKIANDFLSMFEGVPEEIQGDAKKVLLEAIAGLESQIPGLENASEMSLDAIVDTLRNGLNVESGSEMAGNLVSGITTELNNSTGVFSSIGSSLASVFKNAFYNNSKATVPRNYVAYNPNGSHAGGLDYVPFDGYIAQLHKGERVLTAEEAKSPQYNGNSYEINISIDGSRYEDPDKLAAIIANKIQKMTDRRSAAFA